MAKFFDDAVRKPLLKIPRWITPAHFTWMRAILAVPLILCCDSPPIAITLLIVSSILDVLDGPFARARGVASEAGAYLDMILDKVFIVSVLFLACGARVHFGIRIAVLVGEVALVAMRWVKEENGATNRSNGGGGLKVWLQSIAIGLVLTRSESVQTLSVVVFFAALAATVLSFVGHLRDLRASRG